MYHDDLLDTWLTGFRCCDASRTMAVACVMSHVARDAFADRRYCAARPYLFHVEKHQKPATQ